MNLRQSLYLREKTSLWGIRIDKCIPNKLTKKKLGGSVLVSDKIDFKPKLIRTGREGYCILTQGKKTTKKIMQF